MAKYTEITEEQKDVYYSKFKGSKFTIADARVDVSKFAYYMLGIKLFDYQDLVASNKSKRVIICSSRQIGKSLTVSLMALHFALFNEGKTVAIISHSLDQSRKILSGIKDLIYKGDQHMVSFSKIHSFFTHQIDQDATNTTTQITFKNKSKLLSLPATDAARGYSVDSLMIDEAGFVEDDVYYKILEPTVLFTGGRIILSSTPNGVNGFFYKTFDPDDCILEDKREYVRYWFPHWICDNKEIKHMVEIKKDTVDALTFKQEYEALFTVSKTNFFDGNKVDACIIHPTQEAYWKETPCYIGIDWGAKVCQTVVTIGTKWGNKFRVLFQHAFPSDYDNRLVIEYLKALMKDYRIERVIVDDCSIGDPFNRDIEDAGFNIYRFDFKKEKITAFMHFKDWIDSGRVELPNIPELTKELKELIYERSDITGRSMVHKPSSGNDDRTDSIVLSFYPLMDELDSGSTLILV